MANEIVHHNTTGLTLYAQVYNATGSVWNGATFEAPGSANWGDYDIALTEAATATGVYRGTFPAATAGVYAVFVRKQAGGSPAVADLVVGSGTMQWSGTAEAALDGGVTLASDGLDGISTTAPAGVASNFREMVVQTWRRFFKKTTMTGSELKTFADNGTDVVTTQTVSDDSLTQTMEAAS